MDSLFKQYEGVFEEKEENQKEKKTERKYSYNSFALQDAIGGGNAKQVWIEYQKLILSGVSAEEIIYNIISKIKDMVFINKGASASDLGIKDYTYIKSKKDIKNWNIQKLETFYESMIDVLHESRTGKSDLGVLIEKNILLI